MPVVIPWLKISQQAAGGAAAPGLGPGKTWTPSWSQRPNWQPSNSWSKGTFKGSWGKENGFSGGGKGWGKGGKGKYSRKAPEAVPESFQINEQSRYGGSVRNYRKFSGYGFVELSQKGVVPGDSVYVHWKAIRTEDRYPQLLQDMEVEVSIMKVKDRRSGVWTLKAKEVTGPGGSLIAVQDEADAQEKTFVGGQHLRYTGRLQFFSPMRGFGWITMDDGYALSEPVPKELRVDLMEVNAGGKQPPFVKDIDVEFGIMKTNRGQFKGYNMTLPGGIPMTYEGVEHRTVLGSKSFQGTTKFYNWRKGWGFIKPADLNALPPNVVAKIKEMQQKAKKDAEPMLYFRRVDVSQGVEKLGDGVEVTFKVYTDDKGAGACEVNA